jgi:hypothetical protein
MKDSKKKKEKEKIKEIINKNRDKIKNPIGMRITKKEKKSISRNKMLLPSSNLHHLIAIKRIKSKILRSLKAEKLVNKKNRIKKMNKLINKVSKMMNSQNKLMARVKAKKCNNNKTPKSNKTKLNKKKKKRKGANPNNIILHMVVTIKIQITKF